MTLRVRLSIVPFGDEAKEREIHQINISNLGQNFENAYYTYGVEMDKYKTNDYDCVTYHFREDGPLELVYKALGAYLDIKE